MPTPRIIVLTAPSGAGKTTIARRVLGIMSQMRFSVSATTRDPRPNETDGVDYHFVTREAFEQFIEQDALIEFEQVYDGLYYGTLRSEVNAATPEKPVLLDIDVKGAQNVKEHFGDDALVIFVKPPSLDALAERLTGRGTESNEALQERLNRARMEISLADDFDVVVVNDVLEHAVDETLGHIRRFLAGSHHQV